MSRSLSCRVVLALVLALLAFRAAAAASDPLTAKVDAVFADYAKPDSPGCALGVYKDGRIAYSHGYGMASLENGIPITPKTVFYIGSVSKQFTAFAVALLAKQGKLSLDDDVRKYIPELPDYGTPITIRHLIHHTSGLREKWVLLQLAGWREGDVVTLQDVLDLASRQRALNIKPGDEHLYSNTGYDLLAVLVQRVTGTSLREYAQAQIFGPLGMKDSLFNDDRNRVIPRKASAYAPREGGGFQLDMPNVDTVGSGGVYTTIEDLALWDESFYTGKLGGKALIEQVETPGRLNSGAAMEYAFGLGVDQYRGLRRVWHNGALAGYRAMLMRYPEQHLSVALLCNNGDIDPDTLALKVADIYLADRYAADPPPPPPVAAPPQAITLSAQDLAWPAGLYYGPADNLVRRILVRDGKLIYHRTPQNETELAPLGPRRFVMIGPPVRTEVAFEPGPDGAPARMTVTSGGAPPTLFQAVTPAATDPATLGRYAGTYASDELGTTYTLAARDGKLFLQRRKFEDEEITPAFVDAFNAGGLFFRFERGPGGEIQGFSASGGGVRDIRFVKER
jgi:CubicO group peptidase (beta-lactamase class C family)